MDHAIDEAVTLTRAEFNVAEESLSVAVDGFANASRAMLRAECAIPPGWRKTLSDFASMNKAESGGEPESLRNMVEKITRKTCVRMLQGNTVKASREESQ